MKKKDLTHEQALARIKLLSDELDKQWEKLFQTGGAAGIELYTQLREVLERVKIDKKIMLAEKMDMDKHGEDWNFKDLK